MALTTETINGGRNGVSGIKNELEGLSQACASLKKLISGNENYTTFITKTNIGSTLNEKLDALTTNIEKIIPTIESINNTTSKFLDRQEELNNLSKI